MERNAAYTTRYGIRADEIILNKFQEIRDAGGRYTSGILVETGYDYAEGHANYVRKGGAWAGIESGRLMNGVTKQDVSDVRGDFRRAGISLTWEQVDELLTIAYHTTESAARAELRAIEDAIAAKREANRQARVLQRERRRARLECVNCGHYVGNAERATCVGGCKGECTEAACWCKH